jgi:hypothetical protein
MYPTLVPDHIKAEMGALSRNEGKRSPYDAEFLSNKPVKSRDPFKLRSK